MFSAQILHDGVAVYSPWMPRGGDYLIATVDLVGQSDASDQITVTVFTKNREDTGNGTAVASPIVTSTVGREDAEWGPGVLDEMVRYKFDMTSGDGWLIFRMLTPVWFDAVSA